MEITIWKQGNTYNTTIYQTYKSSIEKKASKTLVSTNKLVHVFKVAFYLIKGYKWLDTSNTTEVVKTKKYYNNKSKSKKQMSILKRIFHKHEWSYGYKGTPENHTGPFERKCLKCNKLETNWK